jgi:hypothetical protein
VGYFEIPEDRLEGLSLITPVLDYNGNATGGLEAFVTHDVNAVGLVFVRIGP